MRIALTVCTLIAVSAASVRADWPQYRGPAGNGVAAQGVANANWSLSQSNVLWKTETPLGFSSFSVADGRAFTLVGVDNKEHCLALNADTGEELWQTPLGTTEYNGGGGNAGEPGNRGGDGPRATPATDGQNVYVYDSHLVLTCLDAKTGKTVWRHDVVAEYAGRNIKWNNATSPLLDGDVVYVSGGGAGQTFLAFAKTDGRLIWKSGDEQITHATPSLGVLNGKKQLVCFVQSGLVSLDPATGNELWRTEFPFSVSTAASPVIDGDQVYCSAGYGVGAGLFRVGGGKVEEVWFKANELMNHWSSPLVLDGHLYGIFEFKKYGKAPLQCVELATGEIKWSERGFGPGNCILAGDKLVVLSDKGEVAVVEATPEEYREVARANVIDGKCWSTPAISDGKVYVRSTTEAACIKVTE